MVNIFSKVILLLAFPLSIHSVSCQLPLISPITCKVESAVAQAHKSSTRKCSIM